ncbi:MAG TPA: cytochrome c biogenesis protein CcdA [Candidatus Saccharimonadales bacterium]|nr:cytochrome c biogenesis protein CcdA [Candidatus Saccharimonadales bacterium]
MILLALSFIAGVLTVLTPCILPLLPVIVGGSLGGDAKDRARPYIIVGSLAVSLLLFTLLLKASTLLIGVSPRVWTYLSGGIIIALGLTALFPGKWEQLMGRLGWQAGSQRFLGRSEHKKGPVGAILTGAALGPVFSSCSPTYAFILATVLPQSLASGVVYLIAYTIGLVSVLLVVALTGRRFISRFAWASDTHGTFRRSLGILFIALGISIAAGWEKKAEIWLVENNPLDATVLDRKLID